jgi:hypothetical protein
MSCLTPDIFYYPRQTFQLPIFFVICRKLLIHSFSSSHCKISGIRISYQLFWKMCHFRPWTQATLQYFICPFIFTWGRVGMFFHFSINFIIETFFCVFLARWSNKVYRPPGNNNMFLLEIPPKGPLWLGCIEFIREGIYDNPLQTNPKP